MKLDKGGGLGRDAAELLRVGLVQHVVCALIGVGEVGPDGHVVPPGLELMVVPLPEESVDFEGNGAAESGL
jgi:hypothetical protein